MAKVAKTSRRGSKPGERRGGRKKGVPNKATADIRAIAQQYTAEAVDALVRIIRTGESEQARVAAIKEVLDRGHGRPTQPLSGDPSGPPVGFVLLGAVEHGSTTEWLNHNGQQTGE